MKRNLYAVVLAAGFLCSGVSWSAHTDLQMLVEDLQQMGQDAQSLSLVWWIPNEYWEVLGENDPSLSPEIVAQIITALDDYLIFAVIDAHVGAFAGVTSKLHSEVMASLRLDIKGGETLAPLPEDALTADLHNLFAMMKPVLGQMLGQLGQSVEFAAFTGKNSDGERLLSPTEPGAFSFQIGGRTFDWRLPLGSLLPARVDLKTGETFPGNYLFNPFTGDKLVVEE